MAAGDVLIHGGGDSTAGTGGEPGDPIDKVLRASPDEGEEEVGIGVWMVWSK